MGATRNDWTISLSTTPDVIQQLRFAFRQITRRSRSSVLAIGTIALALGASIGIGTVLDHAVRRPLPYPEPNQLVVVWNTYPRWRNREVLNQFWDRIDMAFPEYEALRARADAAMQITAGLQRSRWPSSW